MTEPSYEPTVFLSTDITVAGADMIGMIGEIKGMYLAGQSLPAWKLDDLKKTVAKAQRALDNYRRAVATDRQIMTRSEFEGEVAEAVS